MPTPNITSLTHFKRLLKQPGAALRLVADIRGNYPAGEYLPATVQGERVRLTYPNGRNAFPIVFKGLAPLTFRGDLVSHTVAVGEPGTGFWRGRTGIETWQLSFPEQAPAA